MGVIILSNKTPEVNLSKDVLKGDDGGYYIPAVDADGNLTWTATEAYMPAVEGSNISGPAGPKGESGVFVGSDEPTEEDVYVWINPNGDADGVSFATVEYVDAAVANIEIPETDLSNYYNKSEVDALIPEEVDMSGYALKTDIPDVSSYTTMSAVEAKGYQTAAEVDAAITLALGAITNAEDGEY